MQLPTVIRLSRALKCGISRLSGALKERHGWHFRSPGRGPHLLLPPSNGFRNSTPVRLTSWVFRVTSVNPFSSAVAAIRQSTTGFGQVGLNFL